ncbi:hypothetical protein KV097_05260 [Mumia sp. zg.B17]|uniref:hypothetical protein n=1 Tax=Mumia sp. zg.B17 TaxID=2855446 RepID=UPI001C6E4DAD|nr:hypothetical protein [Mumia sp. zg.B17]MBW9205346.1 hypothetical protein [Mumia sp. zg.B17]
MSLEILLIPLAMAAVGAAKAAIDDGPRGLGPRELTVRSRLSDGSLVAGALADLDATVSVTSPDEIRASFDARALSLDRNDEGLWVARFDETWTEEEALGLVTDLDAAYGVCVQREVVRKIRERAPAAGLSIAEESVDDDAVTLVLDVRSD